MNFSLEGIQVSNILVLSIMAALGYVFGTLRDRRKNVTQGLLLRLQNDLSRAQVAVGELESVVGAVHDSTAKHYARLKKFRNQVAKLSDHPEDGAWQELCREVEAILDPTLRLVSEIANAQERIRYQSTYLMTFSEVQTDPLTGLSNRRGLDYVLNAQFNVLKRYDTPFSLAIVDIDHFKAFNDQQGHLHGDQMLRDLAGLLIDTSRTVDIVARYGGDEFVVVMPQTDLQGAGVHSERLRAKVEKGMPFTVSIGVASAKEGDTPESLFRRADEAMYRAKTSGRNCTFSDRGETVEPVTEKSAPENTDLALSAS